LSTQQRKSYTSNWSDYQLIDAGGGKKLERFGAITTIRPELQAYFKSFHSFENWSEQAHLAFNEKSSSKGDWKNIQGTNKNEWNISILGLNFLLAQTNYKHIGIFPEQMINWEFISKRLKSTDSFLNLFAYTGIASIIARKTGASVTHVDSVKQLLTWAKTNMLRNELKDIRWIQEDALNFALKEVKRGHHYNCILMDPPAFGYGSKGEKWILEEKLPQLIQAAYALLAPGGCLILNTYSPKLTLIKLTAILEKQFSASRIEASELWMKTSTDKDLFFGNLIRAYKES
jgi:23S rRNA (cytosine1962-C5)-methyltransferase